MSRLEPFFALWGVAALGLLVACGDNPPQKVTLCTARELAQRQTVEMTAYWEADGYGASNLYDPRCPTTGTLAFLDQLDPDETAPLIADVLRRSRPGVLPVTRLTLRGEYFPRTLERPSRFEAQQVLAAEPVSEREAS